MNTIQYFGLLVICIGIFMVFVFQDKEALKVGIYATTFWYSADDRLPWKNGGTFLIRFAPLRNGERGDFRIGYGVYKNNNFHDREWVVFDQDTVIVSHWAEVPNLPLKF